MRKLKHAITVTYVMQRQPKLELVCPTSFASYPLSKNFFFFWNKDMKVTTKLTEKYRYEASGNVAITLKLTPGAFLFMLIGARSGCFWTRITDPSPWMQTLPSLMDTAVIPLEISYTACETGNIPIHPPCSFSYPTHPLLHPHSLLQWPTSSPHSSASIGS